MKHYFIINPTAGPVDATEKIKGLINQYFTDEDQYEIYLTKCSADAYRYSKEICERYPDEEKCFYAGGGDGTTYEVINGIASFDNVYFTVLPFGSCNDFLKVFPNYDFKDLGKLKHGKVMPVDCLEVNGFYSLNVLNVGVDALINYDACEFKKRMNVKKAYNKAVMKNALKLKHSKITLTVDDKVVFDDVMTLCSFANGGFYGGGYNCAPRAIVDDGLMEITIVHNVGLFKFAKIIGRYKAGKHLDDAEAMKVITYLRGKHVVLDSDERLCFCIDGETIWDNHFEINLLEHKINLVLPE